MTAKTATISSVGRQQQQQVDLINEKKLVLYIYSRFPPPPPPLHFSPCYSASDRLPERLVPIIYGHFAAAAAAAEMVHRMPGLPAFKTAVAAAVVVVTTQFCSAAAAAAAVAADTDTGHFWRGTTALTSG